MLDFVFRMLYALVPSKGAEHLHKIREEVCKKPGWTMRHRYCMRCDYRVIEFEEK